MSSISKNSKISLKTTPRTRTRGRRTTTRRGHAARACSKASRTNINGGRTCSKVSDKLKALKNLIPSSDNEDIVKADQLFQETANYIVRLRAQVFMLQRLIQFYGSTSTNEAADNSNVVS